MFFLRPVLKLLLVSMLPTLLLGGIGWWLLSGFSGANPLSLDFPSNVNVAEWTERAKQTTQDFLTKFANQASEAQSSELPTIPVRENLLDTPDTPPVLLTPSHEK